MSTIGQIIYNLQDYDNSGGYISTSNSDILAVISSADDPNYEDNKIKIFENVVPKYSELGFTKLGIQAPPGTQIILNNNKTVMVGRTGIYELDSDIVIGSMKFVKPKKYMKNEGATSTSLALGMEGFQKAEKARALALDALNQKKPSISQEEYWREYNKIQGIYNTAYQDALNLFNIGLNGVYSLPNPENPEAPENYDDLQNIIIDFIY